VPARRAINLPGHSAQAPYSDAVLVGDTLFIAGSIGFEPQTRKLPAKIEDEVKIVLDHMKAVLADAGMTMDDVVSVQVFCPDVATLYDPFNSVYRTYFTKDFPARAFLGSGPLIGGGHFEVMAIAVRGASDSPPAR
jgi:2-iminobutanoate/2-iminopropanoate deaminase